MFLPLLTALALSSGLTLATPLPQAAPCAPIHIMSARGSNQPAGEGPTLTPLASAIAAAYPAGTTTREPIVWPAQLFPYDVNSHNGTLAVAAQLTAYAKRCPTSKIVLLGYSQGAHVIMDSLCGGGGQVGLGSVTRPIDQKIGSHGM